MNARSTHYLGRRPMSERIPITDGDPHRHKCGRCGFIWEHDTFSTGKAADAHNCAKCGKYQNMKHFESEADQKAYLNRCHAIVQRIMAEYGMTMEEADFVYESGYALEHGGFL